MRKMLGKNFRFLVYIESEFQLANAADLCEVKGVSDVVVFARLNGVSENDDRIIKRLNGWGVDKYILKIKRFGFFRYVKGVFAVLFMALYAMRGYVLVLGDNRGFIARAMVSFPWFRIIFVDDGAYSFVAISEGQKGEGSRFSWYTRFESLADPDRNVFYLPYASKRVFLGNSGMIIGAPFSELGIMSLDDHVKCILDAVSFFKRKGVSEILYYPHRNEELVYKYELGVAICKCGVSVESYLESKVNDFPRMVFSWYSTALFVISDRFEGSHVFYRDVRDVSTVGSKYVEQVAVIYKALSKSKKIKNIGLE